MTSPFDVVVVGLGPVGAVLSGLLGRRGLRVAVVDASHDVFALPRAAHVDHTGLRAIQELGCVDELLPKMLPNKGLELVTVDRQTLVQIPAVPMSRSGLPSSMYFHQPEFDRTLRAAVRALPTVDVRLGVRMVSAIQDEERVRIDLVDADGATSTIDAAFLVGCDGASSTVRDALGVELDDLGFNERWMVVDLMLPPGPNDLPDHAVYVCDPRRPTTAVPMPGGRYRFETIVHPGEDPEALQRPEAVLGMLEAWLTPEGATVERAAVYEFHGVVAERWRVGRAFLAGDAAHQMPPFLGQGMCSGMRDATNLAWKLDHVVRRGAPLQLLDTYQAEMEPYVRHVTDKAIGLGRLVGIVDPELSAARDRQFLAGGLGPEERGAFQLPRLIPGPLAQDGAGELFIQPPGEPGERLDDVIGARFLVVASHEDAFEGSAGFWQDRVGAMLRVVGPELDPTRAIARWMEARDADVIVVRPDRHVLAAGSGLDAITAEAGPLLCHQRDLVEGTAASVDGHLTWGSLT